MSKPRPLHAMHVPARSATRILLVAAAGCGAPPSAPSGPAVAAIVATPKLTPDDTEVARVNGRPVWSSCVAVQAGAAAAGRAPDELRRSALDQCVAFELLSQAAEARGLAAGREVAEATRTAAVNRLVEIDFEQRYKTPDDLKQAVDIVMERNAWRMHILELRASTFARFDVPAGAPHDVDARAHALADKLAAELAGETGLFGVHLSEAAKRIGAGSDIQLETTDVRPTHQDDLVAPYAKALYSIPEVGRIAPPVRTQWGWDVVLWTGGIEARERTRDEVVADLFPELRRQQFQ
ncbi:MAG TPA: hypothetical protein VLM79_32625, partial [Kofleriaceae bacterium]|nr:hypothetical protein [Kofleriaceae bacterium]